MRFNFSKGAKDFFSPETLVSFVVGSIVLSVMGNAVTQLLNNWLTVETPAQIKILIGAGLILALALLWFSRSLARQDLQLNEFIQEPPDYRRGLILLVSRLETSRKALEYHLPIVERCWLICSQQTLTMAQELQALAEGIRQKYETKFDFSKPIVINDVNDPLEFADRVNEIYAHLPEGWKENDVIADYTGMTAHASVGMVMACWSSKRPLQYTPAHYDENNRPIGPLDPIEIKLERKSILALPSKQV